MTKDKIAALLLVLFSFIFILLVLFVKEVSATAIWIGSLVMVAVGALVLYLYFNRLSDPKKWLLFVFFVLPPLFMLLMQWLRQ